MLTLDFINVGYGDAILIRETCAGGATFTMLVDCGDADIGNGGPQTGRISAADFLLREGIDVLDLLVITHLHLDHSGGLQGLLDAVGVRELWCNHLPEKEAAYASGRFTEGAAKLLCSYGIFAAAVSRLRADGTMIRCFHKSQPEIELGEGKLRVRLICEAAALFKRQEQIWRRAEAGEADKTELDLLDRFINNTSLRLRLTYAGRAIELPGDVCAACWEAHQIEACDVVKLPHHGHSDSLTPQLVQRLHPSYAVISVSDDREDDCPSEKIVALLNAEKAALLYTDAVARHGASPKHHHAVRIEICAQGAIKVSDIADEK